jgi:hypothetical protein
LLSVFAIKWITNVVELGGKKEEAKKRGKRREKS